jgi:hypothetical protein
MTSVGNGNWRRPCAIANIVFGYAYSHSRDIEELFGTKVGLIFQFIIGGIAVFLTACLSTGDQTTTDGGVERTPLTDTAPERREKPKREEKSKLSIFEKDTERGGSSGSTENDIGGGNGPANGQAIGQATVKTESTEEKGGVFGRTGSKPGTAVSAAVGTGKKGSTGNIQPTV